MNHTLAVGWFGLFSFFLNFYAIGKNLWNRRKLGALAAPVAPRDGVEGRSLLARPGVYITVVVLGVLGFFAVRDVLTSEAEELSGSCITIDEAELREVSCSSPHDAKVVAVLAADGDELCPAGADDVLVLENDESHVMCVDYDG